MDMYTSVTPTVSFLRGNSFLPSAERESATGSSSLLTPLISEIVPTSILPVRLSSASDQLTTFASERPQREQYCSYTQSVLNGNFQHSITKLIALSCISVKMINHRL